MSNTHNSNGVYAPCALAAERTSTSAVSSRPAAVKKRTETREERNARIETVMERIFAKNDATFRKLAE